MNSEPSPIRPYKTHRQDGAALITSLIILLVLTVLGVAAMSGSSLEEMMAGNMRDQSVAFDAAEAALREGERHVESWGGTRPSPSTTASLSEVYVDGVVLGSAASTCIDYSQCPFDTGIWGNPANLDWNDTTSGLAQAYDADTLSSSQPPLYIIEDLGEMTGSGGADWRNQVSRSGITLYRITARGTGLSANSIILLQVTYGKRFL